MIPNSHQQSQFNPNGNWPENLFAQNMARFKASIAPHYESDILPLQNTVTSQKHPWNILTGLCLVSAIIGPFIMTQMVISLFMPTFFISLIGAIICYSIAHKKNKGLRAAKAQLSEYEVPPIIWTVT